MLRTDRRPGARQWGREPENAIASDVATEVGFEDAALRLERLVLARDGRTYRGLWRAVQTAATGQADVSRPATAFHSRRFDAAPAFASVARGELVLAQGSSDRAAIAILQMTLYSLGCDLGPNWIDGFFNVRTREALAGFQGGRTSGAAGALDAETLALLDAAAAEQADRLRAAAITDEAKAKRYRVIVDLAGLPTTLYVLERASGRPVARYLVSPGSDDFPTPALSGRIDATKVRAWWYPPASDWAKDMKPEPPGIRNPMGLVKLHLVGGYYIHGVPKFEEKDLGRPASHGCIRMSAANILELTGRYAGVGSRYEVSFDPALSEALAGAAVKDQILIRDIEAGREYLAAVASGEMW